MLAFIPAWLSRLTSRTKPILKEKIGYKTEWRIRKYADDDAFAADQPFEDNKVVGNLLLNEGIQLALDLIIGAGGTAFNNANSYIGVGDSATAAAATQTGLQAASNKTYKAMSATYPSRSAQTLTFRAVFGSSDANYAWEEFTAANGNSDAATNLNRKTSSQGTKTAGQTWTVDLTITLS